MFSTATMPPAQRAAFWYDSVLRRLDRGDAAADTRAFNARLTRLPGEGAELLEHAGDSLVASRDKARCSKDRFDDISIDFVSASARSWVHHGGSHRLQTGDLVIMDCAQETRIQRSKHRVISLFIPRTRVSAVCAQPARLAGRLLPTQGLPALLRSLMRTTMEQAAFLQPQERIAAVAAAVEMGLSILQADAQRQANVEQFATGHYHAARTLIMRECRDPELTPLRVAASLGCSRAGLYRVFAGRGESVGAAIWSARVEIARHMLVSAEHRRLLISEIAFLSGFREPCTFDRMFKRHYGMTPRDMRHHTAGLHS